MHARLFYLFFLFIFYDVQAISVKSIYDIMKQRPDIEYIKFSDAQEFRYKPFPMQDEFTGCRVDTGTFTETFIVRIPHGVCFSEHGFVAVGDDVVWETIYNHYLDTMYLGAWIFKLLKVPKKYIAGKVAVISCGTPSWIVHWTVDVLGKLIMLQDSGIEYDYLYVPFDKKFMKETLLLLGVDSSKIIDASCWSHIQAEELIVPSYTANRQVYTDDRSIIKNSLSFFYRDWVVQYLRTKFLSFASNLNMTFPEKIFISRNDASHRIIINEDEVFAMFEKKGFKRYCLSELSLLEQVALFAQAKIIAGAHGGGFVNLLYSQPGTKIIEIFQYRIDIAFFCLAQDLMLDYRYIITQGQDAGVGHNSSVIPLTIIEDFLAKNLDI